MKGSRRILRVVLLSVPSPPLMLLLVAKSNLCASMNVAERDLAPTRGHVAECIATRVRAVGIWRRTSLGKHIGLIAWREYKTKVQYDIHVYLGLYVIRK